LQLSMQFTGNMFEPATVNARLYAQGRNINFAALLGGDLPFNLQAKKGRADFSLWSTWRANQMQEITGRVQLHDALLRDRQIEWKSFRLDACDILFKLHQKNAGHWQLAIENSYLRSRKIKLNFPKVAISSQKNIDGIWTQLSSHITGLNLGQLNKIILKNPLFPYTWRKPLEKIALQGKLEKFVLYADLVGEHFAFDTQVKNLSFKALNTRWPNVMNASFQAQGTEQEGLLTLNSHQVKVDFKQLFRKELLFEQIQGTVHWEQQAAQWLIDIDKLHLNTPDIKTQSHLSLVLPKQGKRALMELHTRFYDGKDARQVPNYLPVGIMAKPLVNWIDNAFLSGHVPQGGLLFRGALQDFPFIEQQGVFEVLFDVRQLDLHYSEGWPDIQDINAEVRFFENSLVVAMEQGLVHGATLQSAKIAIDSFWYSEYLNIEGKVTGELGQAIDFLQASPFASEVRRLTEQLHLQGELSIDMGLKIPLREIPLKLAIEAEIRQAQVDILSAGLTVQQFNADLHITEQGIVSDSLTARLFDFPLTGQIATQDEFIQLSAQGATDIAHLSAYQPSPWWDFTQGKTDFQFQLNLSKVRGAESQLQIRSDLVGMSVELPSFNKEQQQAQPLALSLTLSEQGIDGLHFILDNSALIARGAGVNIRHSEGYWQGLFSSPFALGRFWVPREWNAQSVLNIQLQHLDLSVFSAIQRPEKKSAPAEALLNFPMVLLESKSLYYQGLNWGAVSLQAQPKAERLHIKQLNLVTEEGALNVSGDWFWQGEEKTQVVGRLTHQDFGKFLKERQLSSSLVGSQAQLDFNLAWEGSPPSLLAKKFSLSGYVDTELKKGRILGVEPGLGRILGGLDVWKLRDRLSLDFSDITTEGLSFSELHGRLNIERGLVSTTGLEIDAMPAKIQMSGEVDLSTKAVKLQATVLPKFPIAGTIIGNIANSVTKTFVGDEYAGGLFLSLLYEIKGTWDKVEMTRLFTPFSSAPEPEPIKNN